ncbi:unnamed protein product [Linum trigynum]|uniref:Reverse transcriptase domain-containing protein n=1 Tax=Linum trigynum TaxID=586398 RepID=A0AAV2FKV1_9ROSI
MLENLVGHSFYYFLDGMSGCFQIFISPEDKDFTCPYGNFAYPRIPFGLCNALATFHRCMTNIFADYMGHIVEAFMDDFSVYGESFDHCLKNLEKVRNRYEETNIALSWEQSHFMVT